MLLEVLVFLLVHLGAHARGMALLHASDTLRNLFSVCFASNHVTALLIDRKFEFVGLFRVLLSHHGVCSFIGSLLLTLS